MAEQLPHVFVSYASADRERVLPVAAALERAGVSLWLDRSGIVGGASYGPEIVTAIRDAGAFLLCCSAAAFASRNVRQEVVLAWKHGRPILPLRLETVEIPDELAYWLEAAQWVELLDRLESVWLPDALRAMGRLGVVPVPAATAVVPDAPARSDPRTVRLPTPLTALLGREAEVRELVELVAHHRMVTLTGPGGVGKTRLALEAARAATVAFPDGVAFVDLAPIADPALVMAAVAHAVGLPDAGGDPTGGRLRVALRERRLLLLLDNCEQVVAAAAEVAALLAACPGLAVLATSREPLGIGGEREQPVAPLGLPRPGVSSSEVARSDAVRLFVERAGDVAPGFAVTPESAPTVAEICRRLDGLPLAIEIAAARVKLLPPDALLARLERRLPLPGGGRRDVPRRQMTMRDTIAWSHDLLPTGEQVLLRRLAVFAGSFGLEAAEEVAAGEPGIDALAGIASLVDKSLLRRAEGTLPRGDAEPRFRMLETVREFGLERLAASGEEGFVRDRHAAWFLALAERTAPSIFGARAVASLALLGADHANLRAALSTYRERGDRAGLLRLAGALADFWFLRSHHREGIAWLEEAITDAPRTPALRAALTAASQIASHLGDHGRGVAYADALLAVSRENGDLAGSAHALCLLSYAASFRGEHDLAETLAAEALPIARIADDPYLEGWSLMRQGVAAHDRGDFSDAVAFHGEALAIARRASHVQTIAVSLQNLAMVALAQGDVRTAAGLYGDALVLCRDLGWRWLIADIFAAGADLVAAEGDADAAARQIGAADALFAETGVTLQTLTRKLADRAVACARQRLGRERFERSRAEGRMSPTNVAVAEALAEFGAIADRADPQNARSPENPR